jgi:hypothetical protein
MDNKSIYYKTIMNGKAIKLDPKDKREVKREKFNKLKSIVSH